LRRYAFDRQEAERRSINEMKTVFRYLPFQIPQWFVLALFLWLLVDQNAVPLWVTQVFFIVWVVKDLVIYPWVRRAYETDVKTGAERLIGATGITQEPLDPEGFIKINGELWKARVDAAHQPVERNSRVKVRATTRLILLVESECRRTGDDRAPAMIVPGPIGEK
jgi:membrane protein implicated in regulation of membrane protease activity